MTNYDILKEYEEHNCHLPSYEECNGKTYNHIDR